LYKVFTGAFSQAREPKEVINEFKDMVETFCDVGSWMIPETHHVTTFFIGKSIKKLNYDIYHAFRPKQRVEVLIEAVIYIPNKIVIGICFPKATVENEYPHVTLMLSKGWRPVNSNAVLESTCGVDGVFEAAYDTVYNRKKLAKGGVLVANEVLIKGKGYVDQAIFVQLKDPVAFKGVTEATY
jgi:hypothetical protein